MPAAIAATGRNEIVLAGRIGAPPEERELPSGDVVVSFRLVVSRPAAQRRGRAVSDTIDCAVWRADVRRSALGWQTGDVVEATGALRRRFFRTPGGPASRYEVEVLRARRIAKAG